MQMYMHKTWCCVSAAAAVIGMTDKLQPCLSATHPSSQPESSKPDGRAALQQRPEQTSLRKHAVLQQRPAGQRLPQALCLGLGGGTLPLFMSHHFPGLMVEAVELDPIVVSAATQEMGLPVDR